MKSSKLETHKEFSAFLVYLSNPFSIAWRNFLAGTFHGLGFLFGTALFISVISFILNSILGEVPFFSDFVRALNLWIESAIN